jgi:hypothetical protein
MAYHQEHNCPLIPESGPISLSIKKHELSPNDFSLTEAEVGDRIEEILQEFPVRDIRNVYELTSAKTKVANDTRRGVANTNVGDVWFYSGTNIVDRPIQVCEINNRYAVFKVPNFAEYGFRANYI